jgi:hypothetical protein
MDGTSVDGDIRTYDGEEMTYGYTETTRGGFSSGEFYYDERSAQERTFACETKDDKETDDDEEEETDDDEETRTDEGSRADERDFFCDASVASLVPSRDGPSKMTKTTTEDVNLIHSCHETFVTAPTDALRHLFYFRASTAPPQKQGPEATSNPNKQIESLQRDSKMWKEIIARDSKHILRLTAEVDSLRSSGGISVLEKEIEDLRQREKSMLKDMEALQMDLNNDNFMEMEASELKSNEIERLQLQCQMFSFHIVQLEKENQDLTKQNATLRRTCSSMDRSESAIHEITPMKTIETTPADGSLRAHVTSLVHRFSEIEEYMASRDKAQGEQSRTLQALEATEDATIPFVYSSSELSSPENRFDSAIVEDGPCLLLQACSQDEDVEVTLDGLIIATSRIEDPPQPGKGSGPSTTNSTGPSFCCFDSSCG